MSSKEQALNALSTLIDNYTNPFTTEDSKNINELTTVLKDYINNSVDNKRVREITFSLAEVVESWEEGYMPHEDTKVYDSAKSILKITKL